MTPADKEQVIATILAALRTYQGLGYGDPGNRPDDIHDIATCGGDQISMDHAGIDELCEMLNTGDLDLTHESERQTSSGLYSVVSQDDPNRLQVDVNGLGSVLLNRTEEGLIIDATGQDDEYPVIGSLGLLETDFSGEYDQSEPLSRQIVPVTLNTFDVAGNQVDTQTMKLPEHQVSDIIDHASQLVVVMRDMGQGNSGIESFDQVYSQLEEAIVTANIVDVCDRPLPSLHLMP